MHTARDIFSYNNSSLTPLLCIGTGMGAVCLCFVLLVLPLTAFGGRILEEWDDLPQVDSISFSKTLVGLTTASGEYFIYDRGTNKLRALDKNRFLQNLGSSVGPRVAEVKKETGIGSLVALKTSGGKELTTQNAYCSEGEDRQHGLWLEGAPVKDHVDPCQSISAAEIIDDQLWLGTRADGEYGDYPAEGVVVQSLDTGKLIKKLGTEQGLTGDLVRTIRVDSFNNTVWVATKRGINEITRGFRISRSLFFHQDLDPDTGAPKISLTPMWRKSNPLATLFKRLRVSDAKKFYAAAMQISPEIRERFDNDLNLGVYSPANARSREQSFAPGVMNVLVPFVIEAARSPDENVHVQALSLLCAFNDQRVTDYLVEQSKAPQPRDKWFLPACVEKFRKFSLMVGPS
jgi:hypothetical protein